LLDSLLQEVVDFFPHLEWIVSIYRS